MWGGGALHPLQEENVPGVLTGPEYSMPVSKAAEFPTAHSICALAMSHRIVFLAVACNSNLWVYIEGRIRGPCCRSHKTAGKSLANKAASPEGWSHFPRLVSRSSPGQGSWHLKSAKPFFDWPHVANVITTSTTGIPHGSVTTSAGLA